MISEGEEERSAVAVIFRFSSPWSRGEEKEKGGASLGGGRRKKRKGRPIEPSFSLETTSPPTF